MDHHTSHSHSHEQPHHVHPIDPGYRLIVRIVLWLIAGAVLIGLCIWWAST